MSSPVTVTTRSTPTDTMPATTPSNFSDNGMSFPDGETWLFWDESTDDQSAQPHIRYDVFDNGLYEGSLFGSGSLFIVYAELGALNSFQVIAVDEEGNQSSPATYSVDLR